MPWITDIKQVCVVVEDLNATIRSYWESAGIGPWAVWTPKLTNMRIRGKEVPYAMKLALARTNGFMWEVVQPLDGPGIYREHLDRHGEGMHHVLVRTSDREFAAILAQAKDRGMPLLMEGTWGQTHFAYIDAEGPMKMILEVFHREEGATRPEADYFYPHRPENMPL